MKQVSIKYKQLCISFAITLICIIFSTAYFDAITPATCLNKLLIPLSKLICFICIGLIIGQTIELLGWTRHIAVIARPLFRFSHLGDYSGAAFTTAFFSGAASNSMLLEFYEDNKISRMELFLSNYINQLPVFFLHLPTTMLIVLPLTGLAGLLYFALTFLATLLRTICFFIYGRLFLPEHISKEHETTSSETQKTPDKKHRKNIIPKIKKHLPLRITNILIWVFPIYTLVFILSTNNLFDHLNRTTVSYISNSIVPIESLSVIILSFAAEFTSGFAAAGALMDAGVVTTKQTVIALLIGNIIAFPIRALRHQLPSYMGIFSPKTGLQLILSGQLFRVTSIIIVGVLYYLFA